MKVLIIQLSDMHCSVGDRNNDFKIQKAVDVIKTLGKVDSAIMVFSGDLSDKASRDEFATGKHLLGLFLAKLGEELNCGKITSAIVPGNHDIFLPEGCRGSSEIIKWNKEDHLSDEVKRLDSFFAYSKTKGCFVSDPICDVKIINNKGISIQLCLLNSAPFSTREPDDKELHYLPSRVEELIKRRSDVDIKITVMHHHFECCEWNTKELIKRSIHSDDITFFGHDHKSEMLSSKYSDGRCYNIIMGGEFNPEIGKDAAFNVVVFDTEKKCFTCYEYKWSISDEVFYSVNKGSLFPKKKELEPSEEYLDQLLSDTQSISNRFTDYYVFPKLKAECDSFSVGDRKPEISLEEIFKILKGDKVIRITGNSNSGKTALLRFLYSKSLEFGFYPLLIEKRDYKDSKIEKMLRGLFEDQYCAASEHAYELFEQKAFFKTIVFIDDLDLIPNRKSCERLIEELVNSGKYIIYTTKEKNQDLESIVKDKLQKKEIITIGIQPVYKETRDKLVENVGKLIEKDDIMISSVKIALDYMAQSHTNLFDFTPNNTLQYIRFFFSNGVKEKHTSKTLSTVFETNIRSALFQGSRKDSVANVYLLVLEFLADKMYFDLRSEKLNVTQFDSIIDEFNTKKKASVNSRLFFDTCVSSHVLSSENDSFDVRFYDKNIFAYFVAKSISREFEKDQNTDKLTMVMNNICFGINDIIIMFLSFIRSNTYIALSIAKDAEQLMQSTPEWDFDKNNIPFLYQYSGLSKSIPTAKDKAETNRHLEKIEHDKHEKIRFRGIFDFNETDANKPEYITLRAFKYLQLIGRALVDQYGALDANEIDQLLNSIYVVTQKVVFSILKPYQEHYEEIVDSLFSFASNALPDEHISKEQIMKILAQTGIILCLNVMNDISYNISNDSTIRVLRDGPISTSNHRILELMMEENAGNSNEFISRAIALNKEMNNNPFAKMLISQIVRKHIIYNGDLNHRQIDKLISEGILSKDSKGLVLLEKGKGDKQN